MPAPRPPPRPSLWEWAQAGLLAVSLVWTTLCLGGYRPETMVVTSALNALLLAVHFAARTVGGGGSGGSDGEIVPGTTRNEPVGPALAAGPSRDGRDSRDGLPPSGSPTAKQVIVAGIGSVIGADGDGQGEGSKTMSVPSGFHPAGWWLVPFAVYAALNVAFITPVRWLGWRDWLEWAQLIGVFWVVLNGVRARAPRRVLWFTLMALGVAEGVLAGYQHFVRHDWLMLGRTQLEQYAGRASGSFGIPNSLGGFVVLLLPIAGTLAWRARRTTHRLAWIAVTGTLGFALVLSVSRGAWLGLAGALVLWPLLAGRAGWKRKLLMAAGAAGAALALGAGLYAVSPVARERLDQLRANSGEASRPIIWRAGWELFRSRPVFGTGAGSYNVEFEAHRPKGFTRLPQWTHNDYLNTLSDYGLVGAVLFFGAAGAIAWRCARRAEGDAGTGARDDKPWPQTGSPGADEGFGDRATSTALGIGVLAFALHLFVDFHLKIPALAMAVATVGSLAVASRWPAAPLAASTRSTGAMRWHRGGSALAVVGVVWGFVSLALPHYRAEALRYRAHQALQGLSGLPPDSPGYRTRLAAARADLPRAVALAPTNAQAWSDAAYAASLLPLLEPSRVAELGREAEGYSDRAVALAPTVGEFWVWRANAFDMQGRPREAEEAYARALRLSPRDADTWYHYAYHLSFIPTERAHAREAAEHCLSLDPENPNGQWLRQRLAVGQNAP